VSTHRSVRAIRWIWAAAVPVACGLLITACAASGTNSSSDLYWRGDVHKFDVESLSWSPDGKLLASAGHLGTVKVFDIASKQMVAERDYFPGFAHQLAWSPGFGFERGEARWFH
jgi:WD40 repeat protein